MYVSVDIGGVCVCVCVRACVCVCVVGGRKKITKCVSACAGERERKGDQRPVPKTSWPAVQRPSQLSASHALLPLYLGTKTLEDLKTFSSNGEWINLWRIGAKAEQQNHLEDL